MPNSVPAKCLYLLDGDDFCQALGTSSFFILHSSDAFEEMVNWQFCVNAPLNV